MPVRTYNPEKVVIIVGGMPMSGFADGTFVTIAMINDGITTQVGADREIARAINTDRRCDVNITLQQTSQSNSFLSTLFNTDMLSCGSRVVPILVQDLCGDTIFAASEAWVVKPADIEFGNELTNRAWHIQTGQPSSYNVGGNPAN
jgi:hypothetical protein